MPGPWALRAIERRLDADELDSGPLDCLMERSAESTGPDIPLIARLLARYSGRFAQLSWQGVPDGRLLGLLVAVLRARPPSDTPWWHEFWKGIPDSGGSLRDYLYFAVGKEYGFETLSTYVETSIEWEDTANPVGEMSSSFAGCILSRFRGPDVPSAIRLVPESPRMRQVVLYSVPFHSQAPYSKAPWFGSDEAQSRLQRAWQDTTTGEAADRERWRISYIGNQWALAGYAATLGDLRTAFSESSESIVAFDGETRTRFQAALSAYISWVDGTDSTASERAKAVRIHLEAAVKRATPAALSSLILAAGPLLSEPGFRVHLTALLQERLHELHPRARALLVG